MGLLNAARAGWKKIFNIGYEAAKDSYETSNFITELKPSGT
jgi:NTE family protein